VDEIARSSTMTFCPDLCNMRALRIITRRSMKSERERGGRMQKVEIS
jgi:hypothetical protein